jgi:hypothetical protein
VSARRDGNPRPRPWRLAGAVDVCLDGTSMLCGEYDQSVVSDLSWDWIGCGFPSYVGLHKIQIGKHPIISSNPLSRKRKELPLRLLISRPNQPHQDTERGRGPQPIPQKVPGSEHETPAKPCDATQNIKLLHLLSRTLPPRNTCHTRTSWREV